MSAIPDVIIALVSVHQLLDSGIFALNSNERESLDKEVGTLGGSVLPR
jgi:hypothetical protein